MFPFHTGQRHLCLLGVNLAKFYFLTFHLESSYDPSVHGKKVCNIIVAQCFLSDEAILIVLPTSLNSLKINVLFP